MEWPSSWAITPIGCWRLPLFSSPFMAQVETVFVPAVMLPPQAWAQMLGVRAVPEVS